MPFGSYYDFKTISFQWLVIFFVKLCLTDSLTRVYYNVHTLRYVHRKNALLRQTDCHKVTPLFSLSHALIVKILDKALTLRTSSN